MRYAWEYAHLGGERAVADVLVTVEAGTIVAVDPGAPRPGDARRVRGLTVPGFANAHSHAFHRVLRGRAERPGTFWDWRDQMYAVAAALDPERYRRLARAVYAEMALSGITAVGEFHYLHHPPGGGRYADPNEMAEALASAAADAGVRLTLLDACFLERAPGEAVAGVQARYSDGDVQAWAARAEALAERWRVPSGAPGDAGGPGLGPVVVGAAVHSLRAVPPAAAGEVASWAARRGVPFHFHLSEQPAENEAVTAAYGATPAALLAAAGALGPGATAVHATHLTGADVASLGAAATGVCLCPTTERALADGIGPAGALAAAGCPLSLGTDSHAVIDPFEEMRGLELDERLATHRRGHFPAAALLAAATAAGHRALGRPQAGRLAVGAPADWVTLSLDGVRLAGADAASLLDCAVFAASAADVTDVVVGGRPVVATGRHLRLDVAGELRTAVADVVAAIGGAVTGGSAPGASIAFTGIGWLVSNDPATGDGPLGVVTDAALVVEEGRVAWAGPAARMPEAAGAVQVDVGGRAVVPGFVDSHAHLVHAGDRAGEFAARMAGRPYDAGGIAATVSATRAASDETIVATVARLVGEALASGTTTIECKSGYGLTVADEVRSLRIAGAWTSETTFLGAHVVPPELAGQPDAYVELVCTEMMAACAPLARWVDVYCERGAFDADQCRAVLAAGARHGLAARVHANQLEPGPGVAVAVEAAAASADHCTYLTPADVDQLAASSTVATLLPACDFSTRSPYADGRRLLDAGATVALATDCNPGTSYTTSMPLCIALAVREMHLTPDEALWAATAGGARALQRDDVGHLGPGARADVVVLGAPSHVHLAYRPGVALAAAVWQEGRRVCPVAPAGIVGPG